MTENRLPGVPLPSAEPPRLQPGTPRCDLPSGWMPRRSIGAALDPEDRPVSALDAPRGQPYRCPDCHDPVILRRGEIKVPHFAHAAGSSCSAPGESLEHQEFKQRLAQALERHGKYTVQVICPACNRMQTTTYRLPEGHRVEQEVMVGPFRADVAVLVENTVRLVFEVYVTHEVDERKAAQLNMPWMEVAASSAALRNRAAVPELRLRDSNLFSVRPCRTCGQTSVSRAQTRAELGRQTEAFWAARAETERSNEELNSTQHQRELQARAELDARPPRPAPQTPSGWITPYSQALDRSPLGAPIRITVQGQLLLWHPSLTPQVQLCETAQGHYRLTGTTLQFRGTGLDTERYASGDLGALLTRMLNGELQPHPNATHLIRALSGLLNEIKADPDLTPEQAVRSFVPKRGGF